MMMMMTYESGDYEILNAYNSRFSLTVKTGPIYFSLKSMYISVELK